MAEKEERGEKVVVIGGGDKDKEKREETQMENPMVASSSAANIWSKVAGQLSRLTSLAEQVQGLKEDNQALRRSVDILTNAYKFYGIQPFAAESTQRRHSSMDTHEFLNRDSKSEVIKPTHSCLHEERSVEVSVGTLALPPSPALPILETATTMMLGSKGFRLNDSLLYSPGAFDRREDDGGEGGRDSGRNDGRNDGRKEGRKEGREISQKGPSDIGQKIDKYNRLISDGLHGDHDNRNDDLRNRIQSQGGRSGSSASSNSTINGGVNVTPSLTPSPSPSSSSVDSHASTRGDAMERDAEEEEGWEAAEEDKEEDQEGDEKETKEDERNAREMKKKTAKEEERKIKRKNEDDRASQTLLCENPPLQATKDNTYSSSNGSLITNSGLISSADNKESSQDGNRSFLRLPFFPPLIICDAGSIINPPTASSPALSIATTPSSVATPAAITTTITTTTTTAATTTTTNTTTTDTTGSPMGDSNLHESSSTYTDNDDFISPDAANITITNASSPPASTTFNSKRNRRYSHDNDHRSSSTTEPPPSYPINHHHPHRQPVVSSTHTPSPLPLPNPFPHPSVASSSPLVVHAKRSMTPDHFRSARLSFALEQQKQQIWQAKLRNDDLEQKMFLQEKMSHVQAERTRSIEVALAEHGLKNRDAVHRSSAFEFEVEQKNMELALRLAQQEQAHRMAMESNSRLEARVSELEELLRSVLKMQGEKSSNVH